MNIVYLTTTGSSVRRRGDLLQVWRGESKIADVRLFDLERLVIVGSVQITTPALALLLDRGVDVALMTGRGRLRGTLVSGESRNVFLRLAQYDRWRDDAFRLDFGRQLATAKLTAQLRLISRYQRNHPDRLEARAPDRLASCLAKVPEARSIEELRGLEGTAAATYYRQFGRMLHNVEFPGRKMHPSTDPANALLSLGYVLLTNEIGAALEARGFDPAIGFFHGIRYGRKSLALDLVEIFRQPVVDRLTLRLFNRGQISPSDFEGGHKGLRLSEPAFREYLGFYEEQMRSPSDGKDSPDWRRRIAEQVAELQKMLMAGRAAALYAWSG